MNSTNTSAHTAKEWRVLNASAEQLHIVTIDAKKGQPDGVVAIVPRVARCNEDEEVARAKLISSAPDLLAAWEAFIIARNKQDEGKAIQLASRAIIKART